MRVMSGECVVCAAKDTPPVPKTGDRSKWTAQQTEPQDDVFNANRADGGEAGDYFQQWSPCSGLP